MEFFGELYEKIRDGIIISDKGNELLCRKRTWRKLKCILLSERSQSEKVTYCMIPSM